MNIQKTLNENGLENQFSELFEMKVGHIRTTEDYENAYSMDAVMESLRSLPPVGRSGCPFLTLLVMPQIRI